MTPSGWFLNSSLKKLDKYAYEIVNERKKDPDAATKGDLLSLFMSRCVFFVLDSFSVRLF